MTDTYDSGLHILAYLGKFVLSTVKFIDLRLCKAKRFIIRFNVFEIEDLRNAFELLSLNINYQHFII